MHAKENYANIYDLLIEGARLKTFENSSVGYCSTSCGGTHQSDMLRRKKQKDHKFEASLGFTFKKGACCA